MAAERVTSTASSIKENALAAGLAVGNSIAYLSPHLSGAIDLLVVRQPDGTYKCSPFYVRFGKYTGLRSRDKTVKITVNGQDVDLTMHLGRTGEAYFVTDVMEDEQDGDGNGEPDSLSGMMSPPSGYSSGDDPPPYASAAHVQAIQEAVQDLQRSKANLVAPLSPSPTPSPRGPSGPVAPHLHSTSRSSNTNKLVSVSLIVTDEQQGHNQQQHVAQPGGQAPGTPEGPLQGPATSASSQGPVRVSIHPALRPAFAQKQLLGVAASSVVGTMAPAFSAPDPHEGLGSEFSLDLGEIADVQTDGHAQLQADRRTDSGECGSVRLAISASGEVTRVDIQEAEGASEHVEAPASSFKVQGGYARSVSAGPEFSGGAITGFESAAGPWEGPAGGPAQQQGGLQSHSLVHEGSGFEGSLEDDDSVGPLPDLNSHIPESSSQLALAESGLGVSRQESFLSAQGELPWGEVNANADTPRTRSENSNSQGGSSTSLARFAADSLARDTSSSNLTRQSADGQTDGQQTGQVANAGTRRAHFGSFGGPSDFAVSTQNAGVQQGMQQRAASSSQHGVTISSGPQHLDQQAFDESHERVLSSQQAEFSGREGARELRPALSRSAARRILHGAVDGQTDGHINGQAHVGSVQRSAFSDSSAVQNDRLAAIGLGRPISIPAWQGRAVEGPSGSPGAPQDPTAREQRNGFVSDSMGHGQGTKVQQNGVRALSEPPAAPPALRTAKAQQTAAQPKATGNHRSLSWSVPEALYDDSPGPQGPSQGPSTGWQASPVPDARRSSNDSGNSDNAQPFGTSPSERGYLGDTEPSKRAQNGAQRPLEGAPSPGRLDSRRTDRTDSFETATALSTAPSTAAAAAMLGDSSMDLSMCRDKLTSSMSTQQVLDCFLANRVDPEAFATDPLGMLGSPQLMCRISDVIYCWQDVAPFVISSAIFGNKSVLPLDRTLGLQIPQHTASGTSPVSQPVRPGRSSSWRWFFSWRSKEESAPEDTQEADKEAADGMPQETSEGIAMVTESYDAVDADGVPLGGPILRTPSNKRRQALVRRRAFTPSVEQLGTLPLHLGQNTIQFIYGKQVLRAYVYCLHWRTRLVVSDVDGTITKSDVLGHLLPALGLDWSHTGIPHLFTSIKSNGYDFMYLSSRAIAQASITRDYLHSLQQGGVTLPTGPVIISPDGLFPSLYRELVLRRPHEFKIRALDDIRSLFPPYWSPFYAGFGNRDTDEISYSAVGIPPGKIFIINPKGELRLPNCRITTSTWKSLHGVNQLVDEIFPPLPDCHIDVRELFDSVSDQLPREETFEETDEQMDVLSVAEGLLSQPTADESTVQREEFNDFNYWGSSRSLLFSAFEEELESIGKRPGSSSSAR